MGSCHLSKACHQVADGGVGIHVWKVPANVLAASKRCGPPAFEMGEELKTRLKNQHVMKCYTGLALGLVLLNGQSHCLAMCNSKNSCLFTFSCICIMIKSYCLMFV